MWVFQPSFISCISWKGSKNPVTQTSSNLSTQEQRLLTRQIVWLDYQMKFSIDQCEWDSGMQSMQVAKVYFVSGPEQGVREMHNVSGALMHWTKPSQRCRMCGGSGCGRRSLCWDAAVQKNLCTFQPLCLTCGSLLNGAIPDIRRCGRAMHRGEAEVLGVQCCSSAPGHQISLWAKHWMGIGAFPLSSSSYCCSSTQCAFVVISLHGILH